MRLAEDRPIVFFDLETTGTNISLDRIVELSVVKIHPDGERETRTRRLNPEMPIPPEATAVHHISDEDVANEPTFRQIAKNFYIFLEGCDLGGYNIVKFDIPVLIKEFQRAGLQFSMEGRRIVDAYTIFCRMEPRNLTAAYKFFCGKKLEGAHGAAADTMATVEICEAQLAKYGEAVVSFGKYNGTPLRKIAEDFPDFLRWILKADFPEDVRKIASDALIGKFPEKS